jgi:hypothetical protein
VLRAREQLLGHGVQRPPGRGQNVLIHLFLLV